MTTRHDISRTATWSFMALFAAPLMLIAFFAVAVLTGVAVVAWCLI